MNFSFSKILKAAIFTAAFLFYIDTNANTAKIETTKEHVLELLAQKKKTQAIAYLNEFIQKESSKKTKEVAIEFLIELTKKFLFKEAQEAFENSVNTTVENPGEAYKSIEKCLQLEPEQLDCLIQKTRLLIRKNEKREAQEILSKIKKNIPTHKGIGWLEVALLKDSDEFIQKILIKTPIEKVTEENLGVLFIELDRSFKVKNFSRAKEIILYLDKKYSDWPDLIYYRQKLNVESSEDTSAPTTKSEIDLKTIYKNKCKSLSRSAARVFRHDIYLCLRGV